MNERMECVIYKGKGEHDMLVNIILFPWHAVFWEMIE